jgi:hypothetical protein
MRLRHFAAALTTTLTLAATTGTAAARAAPDSSAPPAFLIQTPSSTWSAPVWGELCWGMGLRDVARESRKECDGASEFRWQGRQGGLRRAGLLATYDHCAWSYLGQAADPALWFDDAGLVAAEIHLGDRAACAGVEPRFEQLRAGFTDRHGAPVCLPYADGRACRWRVRSDLMVWIFLARLERSELLPEAADPTLCNLFAVLEQPQKAPRSSGWELPSAVLSGTTEPASWERIAFRRARWGMGVDDLRRSLEGDAAPLGGPTQAFCAVPDAPYYLHALPEEVQCHLAQRTGGARYTGTFVRGRLSSLRLAVPQAGAELLGGVAAALEASEQAGMKCRWDDLPLGLGTVRTGACANASTRARVRIQRSAEGAATAELTVELSPLDERPPPKPATATTPPGTGTAREAAAK